MTKNPLISVVIRTYNSEKYIKRCLDSLFKQKANFEVLVVDSGSTDNTLEIVSHYDLKVLMIAQKNYTPGRSLNLGAGFCKGQYIIFLSSDTELISSDCLNLLTKPLQDKQIGLVYARQIPYKDSVPFEARKIIGTFGKNDKLSKSYFASNVCSAICRSLWKEFLFNENFPVAEDTELARRLIKNGYSIYYNAGCIVRHSHDYTLRELFIRSCNELYSRYFLLFPKSSIYIAFSGIKEALYSFYADFNFCIRNRKYCALAKLVPYNSIILLSYLITALKNNPETK